MKLRALAAVLLFSSAGLAQTSNGVVRRPRGNYAVVDVEAIYDLKKVNPSITIAELRAHFTNLYTSVLANPAVSGLAIQIGWETLNPRSPSSSAPYDWSYLDDAFSSVGNWNTENPSAAPKTIQVTLFAGYFTPQWVLEQIPSCDGLFATSPQTPARNCGTVTFTGYPEPHADFTVLPLPWNPVYKGSIRTFLVQFAERYGPNPAFVSMDVSGPTAASTEILVPQNDFGPLQFGGIKRRRVASSVFVRLPEPAGVPKLGPGVYR
jgi:hypothetical protein